MGWQLSLQYQVAHPGRKKRVKKAPPIQVPLLSLDGPVVVLEILPIETYLERPEERSAFEPVFSRYAKCLREQCLYDEERQKEVEAHLEQLLATNALMQADGYALEWFLDS